MTLSEACSARSMQNEIMQHFFFREDLPLSKSTVSGSTQCVQNVGNSSGTMFMYAALPCEFFDVNPAGSQLCAL